MIDADECVVSDEQALGVLFVRSAQRTAEFSAAWR